MRVYLDNCCYNRPFDDRFGDVDAERFIAYLSRESEDYTEWRQNQFDDLTIEELGRATRESGKRIKSVLNADAAFASLLRKD